MVRPRTPMPQTLRAPASDLIAEIRRLDRRITTVTEITTAIAAVNGSTLTQLHGIGNLLADKILARVGDISRFRSAAIEVAVDVFTGCCFSSLQWLPVWAGGRRECRSSRWGKSPREHGHGHGRRTEARDHRNR
ncbi:MAG TPA: hypothetical protein VGL46_27435 [Pseudonocardiaceae bacterium]